MSVAFAEDDRHLFEAREPGGQVTLKEAIFAFVRPYGLRVAASDIGESSRESEITGA